MVLAWGLLQTKWAQNWLAHQITTKLSRDLQSRISINSIDIGFFNYLNLEGVLVEDQKKDTLLSAGLVQVRITDWFFLKDKAELKYIGLENAVIKLQRTDSVWNYTFLQDYFGSTSTDAPAKKEAGLCFNLKQVAFKNVYLLQKDEWVGRDMSVRIGGMLLDANNISISDKLIDIPGVSLKDPFFALYDYTGHRPDSLKANQKPESAAVVTTNLLKWNMGGWVMNIGKINIENGRFKNDRGNSAPYTYFDGSHI